MDKKKRLQLEQIGADMGLGIPDPETGRDKETKKQRKERERLDRLNNPLYFLQWELEQ